jgi:hypothetical protein
VVTPAAATVPTAAVTTDAPAATTPAALAAATPAATTVTIPAAPTPAGALDDDADANIEIGDEEVPLAVLDDEEDDATVEIEIEDEDTPLGAQAQEGAIRRLWWWVLAIIAAITGKTSYDKKNKKGIFAERTPDDSSEKSDK